MRHISRILIAMVLISAGAYGLHLLVGRDAKLPVPVPKASSTLVPPRIAAQQAAQAADTGAAPADRLIYPGAAARRAIHLGYSVFDVNTDGSMMALPLPPGSAWQTMLALDPTGHQRLVLTSMQPECGFPVVITAYRADQATPVWHGELPPRNASVQRVVDLAAVDATNPLLVSVRMADGAANNFSCNVTLGWNNSQPVKR